MRRLFSILLSAMVLASCFGCRPRLSSTAQEVGDETPPPDLASMTREERLEYYVQRIPTILAEGSPEERRAFTHWRKIDLASLSPEQKQAHLAREQASRDAYEAAKKQADWSSRCGDHPVTLFHASPDHPWNVLHRALWVRADPSGCFKGFDAIDPYLFTNTRAWLEGEPFASRLATLRAFNRDRAASLISAPLPRALMQRALLHVYHWTIEQSRPSSPNAASAALMASELKTAITALALSEREIRALPDNLTQAINSGDFETRDPQSSKPYLPSGLIDPRSAFVLVTFQDAPAARVHLSEFRFGSAFFVHWALEAGQDATRAYIQSLARFSPREIRDAQGRMFLNPRTPQIPDHAQAAIVRRAILWAREGYPVVSPIVESVQGRFYRKVDLNTRNPDNLQMAYLAHLHQVDLLEGRHGLRFFKPFETDHLRFMRVDDPFERLLTGGRGAAEEEVLGGCRRCHSQQDLTGHQNSAGILSFISYTRMIGTPSGAGTPMISNVADESRRIVDVLRGRPSWQSLAGQPR